MAETGKPAYLRRTVLAGLAGAVLFAVSPATRLLANRVERVWDIQVRHAYFGEDVPPIAIAIHDEAQVIAARLGLVLRPKPGGLEVFAPADADWSELPHALQSIAFQVRILEPALLSATAVAGGPPNLSQIYIARSDAQGEAWRFLGDARARQGEELTATAPGFDFGTFTLRLGEPGAEVFLQLDAPDVYFEYHVIGGDKSGTLSVHDGTGDMRFDPVGQRALPDGRMAQVFRSAAVIPLRRDFAPPFQLFATRDGTERVLLSPLPNAAPAGLHLGEGDDRALVAPIFVTL